MESTVGSTNTARPNRSDVTGEGSYILQEDSADEIGRAMRDFVKSGCGPVAVEE